MAQIEDNIECAFRKVLRRKDFELRRELTPFDVPGWDSLNHMLIIGAIQEQHGVKFHFSDVAQLKSIGDLIDLVQTKVSARV